MINLYISYDEKVACGLEGFCIFFHEIKKKIETDGAGSLKHPSMH